MDEKRYRSEEHRVFDALGVSVTERMIELPRLDTRARVLEAGTGEPVLFLHGGPNAAATWAGILPHLDGVRAIMLDRPGCGMSPPLPSIPDAAGLPTYVETLTVDVLDALDLEQVVLVGSSFGGFSALRSAAADPARVTMVVLAGCPAFVPGWSQPSFFTLLRAPLLGPLMLRLPPSPATVRMGLRQLGHSRSLRDGRIADHQLRWELAWQRDSDTMLNDAAMIRRCGSFRAGFDPTLDLRPEELARIQTPVHVLVGTDDPVGGADVARRLGEALPSATVELWEGAGHLPWLDGPARFAASLQAQVLALPR